MPVSTATGYAAALFYPASSEVVLVATIVFLPFTTISLLAWLLVIFAIVKNRHYEDPNNLLIILFGISDLLLNAMLLYMSLCYLIDGGYSRGYQGCVIEALILTIGFCSSGMSVVIIAMDRFLLMCYNFHVSWKKTAILLAVACGISIIFPSIAMFTSLPDFVLLAIGMGCIPNFTSHNSATRAWLILALVLIFTAFATVIFCYTAVYRRYYVLMVSKNRQGASSTSSNISVPEELSSKFQRLQLKFALISANFVISLLPLSLVFTFMLATNLEAPNVIYFTAYAFFEAGPLVNPFLIYYMDARLKSSIDEMLGLEKWPWFAKSASASPPASPLPKVPPGSQIASPKRELQVNVANIANTVQEQKYL